MLSFRYVDKNRIFSDMRGEAHKSKHHGIFLIVVHFFKEDRLVFGFADYERKDRTLFEGSEAGKLLMTFLKE